MKKRNDARSAIDERHAPKENPERDAPEPPTPEGPGSRHETKEERDARHQATRQGES